MAHLFGGSQVKVWRPRHARYIRLIKATLKVHTMRVSGVQWYYETSIIFNVRTKPIPHTGWKEYEGEGLMTEFKVLIELSL